MKEPWFFINFFRLRAVSYFSCETQYIENTRWRGWGSSEEQGRKPMLSKEKIIYSHNFTFSLTACGSQERKDDRSRSRMFCNPKLTFSDKDFSTVSVWRNLLATKLRLFNHLSCLTFWPKKLLNCYSYSVSSINNFAHQHIRKEFKRR